MYLRKFVDVNGVSYERYLTFAFWFLLLSGRHRFLPFFEYLAQNVKEHYLMCCRAFSHCSSPMDKCVHVSKDCAVLFFFFFLTFLHKPVPQDSASSRILCPCITSCDDLASSVQRDYEVHRETRGKTGKKSVKGLTAGSMRFCLVLHL